MNGNEIKVTKKTEKERNTNNRKGREKMNCIKLVVFDIYGTLADIKTREDAYHVWKAMKEVIWAKTGAVCHMSSEEMKNLYYRICYEEKENQKHIYGEWAEIDERKVFEKLLLTVGAEVAKAEEYAGDVAMIFRILSRDKFKIYKGVEATLRELKAKGYRLAILSNAQVPYLEMEMGSLLPYFEKDLIFISQAHNIKKPDKKFYQKLLETAGVPANQAVMVGNTVQDDICPAKELGMYSVYVTPELFKDESLSDGVIMPENFEGLIMILKLMEIEETF